MMKASASLPLIAATMFSLQPAQAQTPPPEAAAEASYITLEPAAAPRLNKFGLSYRMGFNMKVDFEKLGGLQLSDPGPNTGSTFNRNYDNGYNRVDISGNQGGMTWNWGYSSPSSASPDAITLQSDSTPATAQSGSYQDRPQSGVELSYSRELTRGKKWRAGLEAALGYTSVSIDDSQTLTYQATRTSDTFSLNGVVPPVPPYAGTFEGPGPLLSSSLNPSGRTVTELADAATIRGDRSIDSDVFTIRLGPYLELPLSRKFALTFSGGLTLGAAHTKFSFHETVSIAEPDSGIELDSGQRSGSDWSTDFLVGGYAGASLSYAISETVGVFAGAMFQAAGESINESQTKESVLNLGKSVVVSVGLSYSF